MGTSLRGYGRYKRDLLMALYMEFGFTEFTYSAAAKLFAFNRKTFFSLGYDGWLVNKKCRIARSSQWKLSTSTISVLFGNDIPDDVKSEHNTRSRSSRRSKRAALEIELFFNQIRDALEYFSKIEVGV